ncbi:MAG TPA: sulfur carrier protein ThiS [Pirellulales bacterium]
MQIIVNGQSREAPDGLTIAQLLAELKIEAKHVAVEVNMQLVPRGRHAEHALLAGDRLEVVTLVGGG